MKEESEEIKDILLPYKNKQKTTTELVEEVADLEQHYEILRAEIKFLKDINSNQNLQFDQVTFS